MTYCCVMVFTHSALFEKLQKHRQFKGCSILNALNLGKWRIKIHNFALFLDLLALFWLNTCMLLFSRIRALRGNTKNTGNVWKRTLKETHNSYFCVTPKNLQLMFVSWKYYKAPSQKKVILCFDNLDEENF